MASRKRLIFGVSQQAAKDGIVVTVSRRGLARWRTCCVVRAMAHSARWRPAPVRGRLPSARSGAPRAEQLDPERGLQPLDLLADGAVRDMQFLGSGRHAAQARAAASEGAQGGSGGSFPGDFM